MVMRRAIPHLILAALTVGAMLTASCSYVAAYSDTPRMTATRVVSLPAASCSPLTAVGTREVQLSTNLVATETVAYPISGEQAFTLLAPTDGECQTQTAPLSVIKPITVAGTNAVTVAIWQGTSAQPYLQVISASGVGAAALTCAVYSQAATALLASGEPRTLVRQECAPFEDQLTMTYTGNDVTYYEPRNKVTQGSYVVAVRYNNTTATPSALLISCGWSAAGVTKDVCYDYVASTFATNA